MLKIIAIYTTISALSALKTAQAASFTCSNQCQITSVAHKMADTDALFHTDVKSKFTPGVPAVGAFSKHHVWLKVQIKNNKDQTNNLALLFHFPFFRLARMFSENGELLGSQGLLLGKYERNIPTRMSAFKIDLQAGETKNLYFKIFKNRSVGFSFEVISYDRFVFDYMTTDFAFSGIYLGFCILMMILALCLWLRFRKEVYFCYFVFLLANCFFTGLFDGYVNLYLNLRSVGPLANFNLAVALIGPMVCLIYTFSFLEISHKKHIFVKEVLLLIGVGLIVEGYFFGAFEMWHREAMITRNAFMVICYLFAIYVSVYERLHKQVSVFFLLAIPTYCVFSMLSMTTFGRLLPFIDFYLTDINPVFNKFRQLGSGLEIILMSIALIEQLKSLEIKNLQLKIIQDKKDRDHLIATSIAKEVQRIAHDIRKPLGLVTLLIRDIKKRCGEDSVDKKTSAVLDQTIKYASSLIYNLTESGQNRKNSLRAIDLKSLIEQATRGCAVDLQLEHSRAFQGDEVSILRLISNLVDNAVDAARSNGPIWVCTRDLPVKNYIELVVGNHGSPIPKEDLDLLFEDRGSKGKSRGTGLGLLICREIAEMHGGKISCYSSPDRGTEFVVLFPTPP